MGDKSLAELQGSYPTTVGNLEIDRLLGKGKSGYAYLAYDKGQPRVLKIMHDEPCDYYAFSGNKVRNEVESYHHLKRLQIPVPNLITYDLQNQYLVKEYIHGTVASDWIATREVENTLIKQLFQMSARLRRSNLNLDYFPNNFVLSKGKLVYVDYEVNPYEEAWNLESWGLYYWANSKGMALYLKTGDATHINESVEKGIPHKAPFEDIVQGWIAKFKG